ncbi:hypothetical protein H9Q69_000422 [Fusarium xylarioides]|nr:hypothetical protein H9Q69_000422 [Fusarium xylarioides]
MATTASEINDVEKWALLIGINHYLDGTCRDIKVKPLTGCVRDVQLMEEHLKKMAVPKKHIIKLTATKGTDGITENDKEWPTSANIKKALDKIRKKAKPGALVYFHYSGHGIRRRKIAKDLGCNVNDGGDEFSGAALVPTDVKCGGSYLSLYQLGVKIQSMVRKKNLRMTVVLDCCYSGRGLRDDESDDEGDDDEGADTRGIDEEDDSVLESDKLANKQAEIEEDNSRGMTDTSWLKYPTSCTVFTACGVDETAKEARLTPNSKLKNGLLTHWILHTLNQDSDPRPLSYKMVRDNVLFKIRTQLPKRHQTPGIFGDHHYEFFGLKALPYKTLSILFENNNDIFLGIGRAQGVAAGAVYEVRSIGSKDDNDNTHSEQAGGATSHEPKSIKFRIHRSYDLRSKVKPLNENDSGKLKDAVKQGHRAFLCNWALPIKTYIHVVGADSEGDMDQPHLETLRAGLARELDTTHNLTVLVDTAAAGSAAPSPTLRLVVDDNKDVLIQDRDGNRLPWLPKICTSQPGAVRMLARTVNHFTRFYAIKTLSYGRPPGNLPRSRFEFVAKDKNTDVILPNDETGRFFQAYNGQRIVVGLSVRREPKGESPPTYGVIFQLSDQFGVIQRSPPKHTPMAELLQGDGDYLFIEGTMAIPSGRETNRMNVTDTYRAYIYCGKTQPSWDELELHEIFAEDNHNHSTDSDDGDDRAMIVETFPEDGSWTTLDLTIVTREEPTS